MVLMGAVEAGSPPLTTSRLGGSAAERGRASLQSLSSGEERAAAEAAAAASAVAAATIASLGSQPYPAQLPSAGLIGALLSAAQTDGGHDEMDDLQQRSASVVAAGGRTPVAAGAALDSGGMPISMSAAMVEGPSSATSDMGLMHWPTVAGLSSPVLAYEGFWGAPPMAPPQGQSRGSGVQLLHAPQWPPAVAQHPPASISAAEGHATGIAPHLEYSAAPQWGQRPPSAAVPAPVPVPTDACQSSAPQGLSQPLRPTAQQAPPAVTSLPGSTPAAFSDGVGFGRHNVALPPWSPARTTGAGVTASEDGGAAHIGDDAERPYKRFRRVSWAGAQEQQPWGYIPISTAVTGAGKAATPAALAPPLETLLTGHQLAGSIAATMTTTSGAGAEPSAFGPPPTVAAKLPSPTASIDANTKAVSVSGSGSTITLGADGNHEARDVTPTAASLVLAHMAARHGRNDDSMEADVPMLH